ncbi:unnamed protein product [Pleuronectes platessa]|uniref:Uncharacterized protein n=1 Tax=Pleuronectes platessa TaxID=8262 RepID=A0A9N7V5W1_PLEPL|nr:unnamed protein product [Pleuronectes platessa]
MDSQGGGGIHSQHSPETCQRYLGNETVFHSPSLFLPSSVELSSCYRNTWFSQKEKPRPGARVLPADLHPSKVDFTSVHYQSGIDENAEHNLHNLHRCHLHLLIMMNKQTCWELARSPLHTRGPTLPTQPELRSELEESPMVVDTGAAREAGPPPGFELQRIWS